MSIMYGTLLRKYESVKDDYGLVNQRWMFCIPTLNVVQFKSKGINAIFVMDYKQKNNILKVLFDMDARGNKLSIS